LDAGSSVELAIEPFVVNGQVTLNELRLGQLGAGTSRFQIGRHLAPVNVLRLDVAWRPDQASRQAGWRLDVRLEIA
jgi:hypothetical protein